MLPEIMPNGCQECGKRLAAHVCGQNDSQMELCDACANWHRRMGHDVALLVRLQPTEEQHG